MKHNFEKFCKDYKDIENYDKAKADNFLGWCCHHRKGVDIPTEELQVLDMYYNRPPEELIFLTRSEHSIIHSTGENNAMYGKLHSTEAKKKNSEAHKGNKYALGHSVSDEARKRMSEAQKGKPKSEETRKKLSEANKGKLFSEEHKKKLSEAHKGTRWFNNGEINKRCCGCPQGFVPGRLKRK